jgi:hypothetical protein
MLCGVPRLPTSGSELSLLILVSMLPSATTENSPVAYTQFLHWRHSLYLHATDSAFSCIPPQSATGGEKLFEANGSLLLRPADLLASLTDPTLLALCRLRLLLRSFRSEKSLSLPSGMTTVATGQVLLAGPTPAGLAASFAALHVSLPRAVLFTAHGHMAYVSAIGFSVVHPLGRFCRIPRSKWHSRAGFGIATPARLTSRNVVVFRWHGCCYCQA